MPEYFNPKELKHRGDSVVHGGVAYVSGVVPPDNTLTIEAQCRDALAEVDRRLEMAGADKSQLLSATIWMVDVNRDVSAFNAVWNEWLAPGREPARACVGAELQGGALFEVAVIAAVKG
jgi:enamine deaminase RidA (YjgF/YER057c/UK114 family)